MQIRMVAILAIGIGMVCAPTPGGERGHVLHAFCAEAKCADGAQPTGSLLASASGNLYGVTARGGGNGFGTVFEMSPSGNEWTETVLHSFCSEPECADGEFPESGLVMDAQGNLYGTAAGDATMCLERQSSCGVVFELSPNGNGWNYAVLYAFPDIAVGAYPQGNLAVDPAGNLYGTTAFGGYTLCGYDSIGCGTVFELSPSSGGWTETPLYQFGSSNTNDGVNPYSGIVLDSNGNLYGTTSAGGSVNCGPSTCGTVFELSHAGGGWRESILYTFCADGTCSGCNAPLAGLTFDTHGSLYGTTAFACVFELSRSSDGWAESVLHAFTGFDDGEEPMGGVVFDGSGRLYGTTRQGGINSVCRRVGCGTVYQLTPSSEGWTEKLLSFNTYDGAWPESTPAIVRGVLYGSASIGGINDVGKNRQIKGGTAFSIVF